MLESDSQSPYTTRPLSANEATALEILRNLRDALRGIEFAILATGGFAGPISAVQRQLSTRLDLMRVNFETALDAFGIQGTPCSRF